MLDLPPMQTKQNGAGQAYFSAVENPHNPLHEAVKDARDADWDGASLDGPNRGLNTVSMPGE